MNIGDDTAPNVEPLDLTEELEIENPADGEEEPGEQPEIEETVIGFADEDDDELTDLDDKATRIIREQRQKIRQLQRQQHRVPINNNNDPEPAIPAIPNIEDFNYDADQFDDAVKQRDAAVLAHAEWKARQNERENARRRAVDEQAKKVEQQRNALGVSDYDEKSELVRARLSDAQINILASGVDNPAKMIYALGRSESRLDMLAAEENLAKFAVMLGKMEREIKVTKRKPPQVESQVRGATASTAITSDDKELARLEKEAERTGDRSKIIAYRRAQRQQAA